MTEISPYLNFSGNCEQAFRFYQSVFEGELSINRFSEMPPDESFEVDGNLVMHVSLPLGDGQVLMGSDRPDAMGPTTIGDNVQVSISPTSSEEGKQIFDALAARILSRRHNSGPYAYFPLTRLRRPTAPTVLAAEHHWDAYAVFYQTELPTSVAEPLWRRILDPDPEAG